MCACVCARACVCACVHVCACVCVRVRACVWVGCRYKAEWFGFDTHEAALEKYKGLRKYDDYYCKELFAGSTECKETSS